MKKKSLIRRLLPWVLLLAVLGGTGHLGYLLWGRPESEALYTAEVIRRENENQEKVILDNGKLHLEMDPETTQFVLTDVYGHEWKSNPFADPAASGEKIASGENKNALASPLNVYYRLPKKAVDNMYDAYTYSISRSAYRIEKIDENTLEVTYSLGDIATEFMVPESLIQERYSELSDAVKASGNNKQKFTGKYTGKKSADVLKNLESGDEAAKKEAGELISSYPQIAHQDIRIISAKDNNAFGALETLLQKTGYSEEERQLDIVLSRSSYRYTYHRYTPEEVTALREGSGEEQRLAEALLAKNPALSEEPGYILQRVDQVFTPAKIEALLAGSEAQAEFAARLMEAWPEIQHDPVTVVPLSAEDADVLYTPSELVDEETYSETEALMERSIFEVAEKPVEILFDVKVRYRLDGNDFIAEVPYGEMKFNSAGSSLSYISLLPMFGAVGAGEDGNYEEGYLLVPEGGGALIRFNNRKFRQAAYYADLYGYDYGIKRTEFISESKAHFPVFGILRKEQSFLCVVEGGTSFVSIRADINGNTVGTDRSSYNYANAKAQVLHLDQYNVSAKTSELQLMYEKQIPETTLVQRYRFTDSGDYAVLAASYGEYLREHVSGMQGRQSSDEVPVSVELIGGMDKRVVTAGMPVKKVIPVTSFRQGREILERLRDGGVRNLAIRYAGWLKGGVKQKVLTGVRVLNELGGEKGAEELIRTAGESGIPLYFDGITAFAYDSGLLDGYMAYRDAARHITREVAEITPYSPIYYTEDDYLDPFTLVHPDYAKSNASRLISWLKDKGAQGISFRDIGCMLSADYDPNRVTNREQVREMNIGTLAEAKEAGEKIMVKEGFDFTLPYADLVTDMDLSGNRYVLLDEFIPFYQIAIHGMVDYTGPSLNTNGDYRTELLRSVEYGAGLNYTFMAEDASATQETSYTGLNGTSFSAWEEEMMRTVLRYQREAAGLNRQKIVGHRKLSGQVTATTYEDGTVVYVNYGQETSQGEVQVPARDYLIVRKGEP
ncbi:MAG: hypothetical protein K5922_00325 [Clostridiales bacterium]|nr:hypothetical protein [Clostridiales bacterium]